MLQANLSFHKVLVPPRTLTLSRTMPSFAGKNVIQQYIDEVDDMVSDLCATGERLIQQFGDDVDNRTWKLFEEESAVAAKLQGALLRARNGQSFVVLPDTHTNAAFLRVGSGSNS